MTAKNDITGDSIATKSTSEAYRDNWDRIFGKKKLQAMYAHGSMFGTYRVPCEVLETLDGRFVIKFFDEIAQEEDIRTVDSQSVSWE